MLQFIKKYLRHSCMVHNLRQAKVELGYRPKYLELCSTLHTVKEAIIRDTKIDDDWKKKIIYNEILQHETDQANRGNKKKQKSYERTLYSGYVPKGLPVFMKCMEEKNQEVEVMESNPDNEIIDFPLLVQKKHVVDDNIEQSMTDICSEINSDSDPNPIMDKRAIKLLKDKNVKLEDPHRWCKQISDETEFDLHDPRFGTSDPNIPVSKVPCGGCGALLHCTSMTVPGFIPKETFLELEEHELRGMTCQRCMFLQEYNIALGIQVNPEEYIKIISQIKRKRALVILLVDMLDFPCSIVPNILDIIGKDTSIFVVGNKMDLLIKDQMDFVKHRKKCLKVALEDIGIREENVKHIALISAKTGYGIENLITAVNALWQNKGDTYIIGCTNAGKSTLFNLLIKSDFCKTKAADVLQRATVSQWPGTTLNLLKFPILKPVSWRTVARMERLKVSKSNEEAYNKVMDASLHLKNKHLQTSLMGFVGTTFRTTQNVSNTIGFDPNDNDFINSKWCYDTPGVVHEAQILSLLTTSELAKLIPQSTLIPRNFKLNQGHTLFIGGVARLDFIYGTVSAWFTVYASANLPVTITKIEDADEIYQKLLGTEMFVVPHGTTKRLEKWPALKSLDLKVYGKIRYVAGADIVLSSAGWIAVTTPPATLCQVRAWTPSGVGIFLRDPPLIPKSLLFRGNRISGTPAFHPNIQVIDETTLYD